jgi:4-hydroxyphenylpyruvate dioxygenase
MGGFEFMAPPPPDYYEGVRRRAGDMFSEDQIKECQELFLLSNLLQQIAFNNQKKTE